MKWVRRVQLNAHFLSHTCWCLPVCRVKAAVWGCWRTMCTPPFVLAQASTCCPPFEICTPYILGSWILRGENKGVSAINCLTNKNTLHCHCRFLLLLNNKEEREHLWQLTLSRTAQWKSKVTRGRTPRLNSMINKALCQRWSLPIFQGLLSFHTSAAALNTARKTFTVNLRLIVFPISILIACLLENNGEEPSETLPANANPH